MSEIDLHVSEAKPMSRWELFRKASRFQVIPVMIMPVVIGATGSFAWNREFHFWWFLVTLIGAAALHLFSNMINDLWDYRSGVDDAALHGEGTISTNSGFLANNVMSEQSFARLTWALFGLSLLCGLVLIVFRGPWVLFYGLLGALLAYFYVAPPIRYGYRGKGYSEVSIVISFGILPVLGSYYVQTLQYDTRALLASLPVGLLTTLILFNHHFLHWQADEASGKRTLVVVWGEQKSLLFSRFLLLLSYISVIIGVLCHAFPVYGLLALLTVAKPWKVYRSLQAHNPSAAYLPLMGASLAASTQTGLILALSLLIHGWFGW